MSINVPFLPEIEIEEDASLLLAEYEATTGKDMSLPIPIDDITRYQLALQLDFADLHETLNIPKLRNQTDIFGAIWVDKEIILIDQSLNPNKSPSMLGRYRFSVGHEIGHWRLHRTYVVNETDQTPLFETQSPPTVMCRTSQKKKWIEWQADHYSSCLLMPRGRVHDVWKEEQGRDEPLLLPELRSNDDLLMRAQSSVHERGSGATQAIDNAMFEIVAKPLASRFEVSAAAMRIRLEKLGLLLREAPQQRTFANGF